MNEIIRNIISTQGLILITTFTILFLLVGLVIKRRQKKNREVRAPRIMRYLILPSFFIYVVSTQLFDVSRDNYLIKIIETIIVIFIISFIVNMICHLFFSDDNFITRKEIVPKLGRDIIHFFTVTIASVFVFSSIWDFDLGSMLTALGVSSFVIGLALQEPLGNLFNGVSLLMAKPFKNGDWVQIGEEHGKVVEFNWNSVKLVNLSNELIIIPNNKFGKEQIKNLSRPNRRHAEMVKIGFSYEDDPIKVKKVLLEVANNTEGILDSPKPIPLTLSYDDFYITYGLKFYVKDFQDLLILRDRLMTAFYHAAKENGITIPLPIREVVVKNEGSKRDLLGDI
jgi:small-conductance mechanosensitive channel